MLVEMVQSYYCKIVKNLHEDADKLADARVESYKDLPDLEPLKGIRRTNERDRKRLHKYID
jgi:hypothetical protein